MKNIQHRADQIRSEGTLITDQIKGEENSTQKERSDETREQIRSHPHSDQKEEDSDQQVRSEGTP
jgi:hypothetical protein